MGKKGGKKGKALQDLSDDDEVVEGSSYEEFDAHTDHLHSWVHCWWVANGYGGDGAPCFAPYDAASQGVNLTREVMLRAYAAEKGEQVRPLGPFDSRPAPPPPLGMIVSGGVLRRCYLRRVSSNASLTLITRRRGTAPATASCCCLSSRCSTSTSTRCTRS